MKFSLSVIFLVLIAAAFVSMMHIKNGVRDMRSESQALREKRDELASYSRVLDAERAYLSRAARLAEFAEQQGLQEIKYTQMVELPELRQAQASGGR